MHFYCLISVADPIVEKALWPGDENFPQADLVKKQMSGFGGMITFWLKGGMKESRQFLENLKVPVSLY